MISTAEAMKRFGKPNEKGTGYLVAIPLPYPMRLAWDTKVKVTRITCHKLVAEQLKAIFCRTAISLRSP